MYVPLLEAALLSRAVSTSPSAFNTTLQIPTQKPPYAERLDPHLAAFSIEMDRWTDWAGPAVGQPNVYVNQLLKNLGERSGQMPFLRLGANSEDRGFVDSNIQVFNATFPPPTPDVPNPEANRIQIGRDFYALSGNLPAGTSFMWGLNFKSQNKSETVAQASLLAEAFQGARSNLTKGVHLTNVEIGNEPDFYGPTPYGAYSGPLGPLWTPANYSSTWRDYAKAVSQVINLTGSGPRLAPGALTGFIGPIWSPAPILQAGILDDQDLRSKTDVFSGHSYSGGFGAGQNYPAGSLMDPVTTRANWSARAPEVIPVRASGLKYILGETNSYANHGRPLISDTVEGAIWATNWMLFAATSGVQRVHFHQGRGFRYNAIQATDESEDSTNITRPHILPSYHSFLIVNEAIGTSGESYIAELGTRNSTLTAFGFYEKGQLARILLNNANVYSGQGDRQSFNVRLVGGQQGMKASVKRLKTTKTVSFTGVTWAGQSFEGEDGKATGSVVTEPLNDGWVNIEASTIVLVDLQK